MGFEFSNQFQLLHDNKDACKGKTQSMTRAALDFRMNEDIKMLVVEDNDFVRMQIVQFLKAESYQIEECTNGRDALEKIDTTFDVAIVDVRMEPIDGFEFIRNIRGQDLDTSVILVTGDQNPDLLNEASKWDVGAVMMKPVQKDRLLKTVDRILKMKARHAQG